MAYAKCIAQSSIDKFGSPSRGATRQNEKTLCGLSGIEPMLVAGLAFLRRPAEEMESAVHRYQDSGRGHISRGRQIPAGVQHQDENNCVDCGAEQPWIWIARCGVAFSSLGVSECSRIENQHRPDEDNNQNLEPIDFPANRRVERGNQRQVGC